MKKLILMLCILVTTLNADGKENLFYDQLDNIFSVKLDKELFKTKKVSSSDDKKSIFSVLSDTEWGGKIQFTGRISSILAGHTDAIYSLSYSPDGKYLASGSNNTIKIWDVNTSKETKNFIEYNYPILSLSYSPNGKYLASGVKVWDVNNGKGLEGFLGHRDLVTSVCYSPDGKYLASGSGDKTIKIWDTSSGKEVKTLIGHNSTVWSLCYSPDGKYLASSSLNDTIKIWDVSTGKEVKTLSGHSNNIYSVSYSPDGKYLASGSGDKTIKIWDVLTGKEIKSLTGHRYGVRSVSYSPDGKYLASGSDDETIKIWDALTGKEMKSLTVSSSYVRTVCYSPDGKYLAIGSNDGTIKIWEIIGTYKTIKARVNKKTNILNEAGEIIGALPQGIVSDIVLEDSQIYKPIKGSINTSDFELLYNNTHNVKFYTLTNTPVYIDTEKTKVLTNIEKGKIIDKFYYSFDLDMYYIEKGNIKGWISSKNIDILKKQYNKVTVINNNTNSYRIIDGMISSKYNSGDILEFDNVNSNNEYLYTENIGWLNKKDTMLIDETNKVDRFFVNNKDTKFSSDFTGYNYKNVAIGTEYKLLGTTDKYYLVESKSTREKGWILKSDMSFTKPDLNDPVILITSTNVDENNMLTISGKIYDDTAINSFLLNGNKMTTKPLNTFDKLSYIPEVGYSFNSQWFLIEGMENNIEIKVTDRDEKTYSKVLHYTPELKTVNLNEFQIENIVTKLPKLEYSMELKDENNDGVLSGTEKINLIVKVVNTGDGEAKNVNLKVNGTNPNLLYNNTYPLGTVKPNETKIAVIEIKGKDDNISLTKSNFDLAIEEANGFNPFPAKFSFNTEPKLNPKLEIIDYAIDDDNKNGQIEQGEKFDLYVLIQNTGEGE
ncbi:MAG: hypothetical protein KBF12_14455, partial [Sebaldella sp.]|nr:hypothetical protein [Sebaldella sp.]